MPKELSLPTGYEIAELNDFAAIRLYEEGAAIITPEEISSIISQADKILIWARALVAEKKG